MNQITSRILLPMPAVDATASVLLILATGLLGLALIPLGLPGLWVIVLGILGFGWLTEFRTLGVGSIVTVLGLALLCEAVEAVVGFRFAQRYGAAGGRYAVRMDNEVPPLAS